MKYALVNGEKATASKGVKGFCRYCGSELIAKCGEVKVHHWAHKGKLNCDSWWENETDWHRTWKNYFPEDWQEVIHKDKNGDRHIADVETPEEWVIEFQHSYLNPEERRSRIAFYSKLVWVVDGTKRALDAPQFEKLLNAAVESDIPKSQIKRVRLPEKSRLLREWQNNDSLVFFDFNEVNETEEPVLWLLFPMTSMAEAYLSPFSKNKFVELHKGNKFDHLNERVNKVLSLIRTETARKQQLAKERNDKIDPIIRQGLDKLMQSWK